MKRFRWKWMKKIWTRLEGEIRTGMEEKGLEEKIGKKLKSVKN